MTIKKIGKYEIIRELGKGATSVVYEALDPFVNRHVAMKVVFQEALGDKEHGRRYRKLFVTEASLAGKLSHPHIVSIYDAVADDKGEIWTVEESKHCEMWLDHNQEYRRRLDDFLEKYQ